MRNAFDVLKERGFIAQCTHEDEVRALLEREKVTFYIGFDPTADSLTIGGFVQILAMMHLQQAGHRPIMLMGGGTGMVGDPTDKSDMRRMMTREEVQHNVNCFKAQVSKYIDLSEGKAFLVDNADWLLSLNYVDFIREYGVHFSVNRMLTADSYRTRFEHGLTFFELNYMLMQSYDFLELYRRYGCKMQMGGQDQWSNIIAGENLIRKMEGADAYGLTFTLLVKSDGQKMGKSQKGAIWLDPNKTTPYELFHYWRTVEDGVVGQCLGMMTLLPMDEVNELRKLEGSEINKAKEILAYEITKVVHGKEEADKALQAERALFSGGADEGSIPTVQLDKTAFENGMPVLELLEAAKLIPTRAEGRRLIQQGGIKINDVTVKEASHMVQPSDFADGKLMIQKGKKVFVRAEIE